MTLTITPLLFLSCSLLLINSNAFVPSIRTNRAMVEKEKNIRRADVAVSMDEENEPIHNTRVEGDSNVVTTSKTKTKKLGLLTFDLDDTLYPIEPVIEEADAAFARSMKQFGFTDIKPQQIGESARQCREDVAEAEGPEAAAVLSHTDVRRHGIRKEMEKAVLKRKLKAISGSEAVEMSSISPMVVENAKTWARASVSESIVEAVLQAWEMERHHAAERHLYPEVVDALRAIREEHPGVVIGAVTDGKANPLLMTFTLAPYFDFCISWEDDQGGRSNFFRELSSVTGNADLKWIYKAAVEKYNSFATAQKALDGESRGDASSINFPDDEVCWVHVGDDLAYDIGGASQCGAKTVLLELASKYKQTARYRFENLGGQPSWSTTTRLELEKRKIMNAAAEERVDARVAFLSRLPETIADLLVEW